MNAIVICLFLLTLCSTVFCECGKREFLADGGKITNGRKALENEFPWIVSLGRFEDDIFIPFCGGSVIDKRWILTAAHCLQSGIKGVFAVIGVTNVANFNKTTFITAINRAEIHENYKQRRKGRRTESFENDIALLLTARIIPINGVNINTICLPTGYDRNTLYSESVRVSGWGRKGADDDVSDDLKAVEVRIYDDSNCEFFYNKYEQRFHRGIMFCAGDRYQGRDSCKGDSGGPVERIIGNKAILVGVVSFGDGCGQEFAPGVYTKVLTFVDWIQYTINREKKTVIDIQDTETCGSTKKKNQIKNGDSNRNQFPWTVALEALDSNDLQYKFICNAAIINDNWILATASCVAGQHTMFLRSLFATEAASEIKASSMASGFKRVIIHPNFNNITFENDIALLKTLRQMPFNLESMTKPLVNAICLPTNTTTFNDQLYISYWNRIQSARSSNKPLVQSVSAKLVNNAQCRRNFSRVSRTFNQNSMLCSAFSSDVKECQNFIGSPVHAAAGEQQFVAALISSCSSSNKAIATVNTKISEFVPWVIDTITIEERNEKLQQNDRQIAVEYERLTKHLFCGI